MNIRKYIVIFSVMLATWTSSVLAQDYVAIVCAGATGMDYSVQGNPGSSYVWTVTGGTIVENYGDSIIVDWGDDSGVFDIRVQEISSYGCPALPKSGQVLVSAPDIELGSDLEICEGGSIEVDPSGVFYSYLWQDNSTAESFISSTEGYIRVEVSDQYGCKRSDSLYLTVHPLPYVDLGPDTSLCGNEQAYIDAGEDGILFSWSTGEGSREISIYDEGGKTIMVEVTDANNCVSYDTLEVLPCSVEERFKDMPTAFTPNGDGKNDVWRIPEVEPFPAVVVEIYDRWGNLVFRSDPGYSTPWNGISQAGKEMPMDSYYFVIDLGDNISEPLVGTVTLIK